MMSYTITIKELASECNRSEQALYTFMKKHPDYVKKHSERRNHTVYYSEQLKQDLLKYYEACSNAVCKRIKFEDVIPQTTDDDTVQDAKPTDSAAENEKQLLQTLIEEKDKQIDFLNNQVEELKKQISFLQDQINIKDKQQKDTSDQVAMALMMLGEEKKEKQLYLPAPHKGIGERIKHVFDRTKKAQQAESK